MIIHGKMLVIPVSNKNMFFCFYIETYMDVLLRTFFAITSPQSGRIFDSLLTSFDL